MVEHLGFQLFLAKRDRSILLPIISHLQSTYANSPEFEPHLSIHTAIRTERDTAIRAVDKVTNGIKRFIVKKESFGYQDKWYKILYIQISKNNTLDKLHAAIGNSLESLDNRPFIPHISLIYKDELADDIRQKITNQLKVPDAYEIAGIEIVHPGTDDIEWRDYTKWNVIYRKSFD